jgi:hypothetical protein
MRNAELLCQRLRINGSHTPFSSRHPSSGCSPLSSRYMCMGNRHWCPCTPRHAADGKRYAHSRRFRFSSVDSDHNLHCIIFSMVVPSEVKYFDSIDDASLLTWSQIIAQREAAGLPTDVVPEKVIYPKHVYGRASIGLTASIVRTESARGE